jgi:hypothetical protein
LTEIVILIPTYWTWGSEEHGRPVEAVFDHPTPVDAESTLPRLLSTLCHEVGPPFAVWVLTATAHRALEQAAEQRVSEIIAPFRERLPIALFAASDLAVLHKRIRDLCQADLVSLFSRGSYAGVRNCQLVIPCALGAEVAVALDDDEVITPGYLQNALHFVGSEQDGGQRVLGVTGLYLNANGGVLLPENPRTGNIFVDKSAVMNEGMRTLQGTPGRLVHTPLALGGNMVFHRDLLTRVGFDIGITRGEDMDYLINARLAGHCLWLDKELLVTHLPPQAYNTHPYARLAQDAKRFIYEREKLGLANVDPAQFDPYPGLFLRDGVAAQALTALESLATAEAVERFGAPQEIIETAERSGRKTALRYFELAARWPDLIKALGQDTELRDWLLACFDRAA